MKHTVTLPTLEVLEFDYDKSVYDPNYTSPDPIVVADALIRKSRPNLRVLDLACGTGLIGLSLKFMHPELDLMLSDISGDAIKMARKNACNLELKARFKKTDMLKGLSGPYDMIVTNLPSLKNTQKANHSPKNTLFDHDLTLYKQLFDEAPTKLLVHYMQPTRQKEIELIANSRGWKEIIKTDLAYAWLKNQ